ncbi:hypothetical protein CesoFtcFv8_005570 [Champsocephalus esox]|uniref:Uncharacterized protein n=1 Tax=Champsocephalus esox TaxID=159716 RepID=A0AAN8CPW8_9TELE|nr:hypothetical protein CesoFtcFv8_005570 [Champsocephalus esox]
MLNALAQLVCVWEGKLGPNLEALRQVSRSSSASLTGTPSSSQSNSVQRRSVSFRADHSDSSLLGSYGPRTAPVTSGSLSFRSSPESRLETQNRSPVRWGFLHRANLHKPSDSRLFTQREATDQSDQSVLQRADPQKSPEDSADAQNHPGPPS